SRGDPGWPRWMVLGALGGLLVLSHTNNAVFLLFPALELVAGALQHRHWLQAVWRFALLGLFALVGVLPQLVLWWFMFGTMGTPYGRYVFPERPEIVSVLVSPYHGLFFYAPVLALATLGLIALWRTDRLVAAAALGVLGALV